MVLHLLLALSATQLQLFSFPFLVNVQFSSSTHFALVGAFVGFFVGALVVIELFVGDADGNAEVATEGAAFVGEVVVGEEDGDSETPTTTGAVVGLDVEADGESDEVPSPAAEFAALVGLDVLIGALWAVAVLASQSKFLGRPHTVSLSMKVDPPLTSIKSCSALGMM
jgi:hypothetical protein